MSCIKRSFVYRHAEGLGFIVWAGEKRAALRRAGAATKYERGEREYKMFCNNSYSWLWLIIILILLFSVAGGYGCGCGCGNDNNCGCNNGCGC